MNDNVTVRKALNSDIASLIEFNVAMALETEQKRLSKSDIEPGVKVLFQKPEYGFYIVAEVDGCIAGCLMITNEWSDWRNGLIWWIQSVYVFPEFRRRGVYRTMYHYVLELAERDPEVCGCRLYVEQDNLAAQQTYKKLGMSETHYKMFEQMFRE